MLSYLRKFISQTKKNRRLLSQLREQRRSISTSNETLSISGAETTPTSSEEAPPPHKDNPKRNPDDPSTSPPSQTQTPPEDKPAAKEHIRRTIAVFDIKQQHVFQQASVKCYPIASVSSKFTRSARPFGFAANALEMPQLLQSIDEPQPEAKAESSESATTQEPQYKLSNELTTVKPPDTALTSTQQTRIESFIKCQCKDLVATTQVVVTEQQVNRASNALVPVADLDPSAIAILRQKTYQRKAQGTCSSFPFAPFPCKEPSSLADKLQQIFDSSQSPSGDNSWRLRELQRIYEKPSARKTNASTCKALVPIESKLTDSSLDLLPSEIECGKMAVLLKLFKGPINALSRKVMFNKSVCLLKICSKPIVVHSGEATFDKFINLVKIFENRSNKNSSDVNMRRLSAWVKASGTPPSGSSKEDVTCKSVQIYKPPKREISVYVRNIEQENSGEWYKKPEAIFDAKVCAAPRIQVESPDEMAEKRDDPIKEDVVEPQASAGLFASRKAVEDAFNSQPYLSRCIERFFRPLRAEQTDSDEDKAAAAASASPYEDFRADPLIVSLVKRHQRALAEDKKLESSTRPMQAPADPLNFYTESAADPYHVNGIRRHFRSLAKGDKLASKTTKVQGSTPTLSVTKPSLIADPFISRWMARLCPFQATEILIEEQPENVEPSTSKALPDVCDEYTFKVDIKKWTSRFCCLQPKEESLAELPAKASDTPMPSVALPETCEEPLFVRLFRRHFISLAENSKQTPSQVKDSKSNTPLEFYQPYNCDPYIIKSIKRHYHPQSPANSLLETESSALESRPKALLACDVCNSDPYWLKCIKRHYRNLAETQAKEASKCPVIPSDVYADCDSDPYLVKGIKRHFRPQATPLISEAPRVVATALAPTRDSKSDACINNCCIECCCGPVPAAPFLEPPTQEVFYAETYPKFSSDFLDNSSDPCPSSSGSFIKVRDKKQ